MTMDERQFWIQVRRGLLMIVAAIEQRWSLPRASLQPIGQKPPESTDKPAAP
jgi:hypothetical protein